MDLVRELVIAFVMAILAAWFLELFKPGRITNALVWMVSRMVPREIRQDHYSDWRAEAEAIRADPTRKRPFAAARFALGQVAFAVHLIRAQQRLDKARDPNYVSWWQAVLLVLSIPGIPAPTIFIVLIGAVERLSNGDFALGFGWLGLAAWQVAGASYIIRMASSRGIPITFGTQARRRAVHRR
jgi:hypothetical protein